MAETGHHGHQRQVSGTEADRRCQRCGGRIKKRSTKANVSRHRSRFAEVRCKAVWTWTGAIDGAGIEKCLIYPHELQALVYP
ncbi:hypothetical protein DESC_730072 [Desulfosarcina cetonica]|nr:hypothetical protein DESC_730072 [Desulfosarcina cetonica]